jgi:hypothetical protein
MPCPSGFSPIDAVLSGSDFTSQARITLCLRTGAPMPFLLEVYQSYGASCFVTFPSGAPCACPAAATRRLTIPTYNGVRNGELVFCIP